MMRLQTKVLFALYLGLVLMGSPLGCSVDDDDDDAEATDNSAATTSGSTQGSGKTAVVVSTLNIASALAALTDGELAEEGLDEDSFADSFELTAAGNQVGVSTASSIQSLKYLITDIDICESMTIQGSGFSNANGCLSIYHNASISSAFDYTLGANNLPSTTDYDRMLAAARASNDGFIDLMSATDRARLSASTAVSATDARAYRWGNIRWKLPYKLKAEISVFDTLTGTTSGVFRTNDGVVNTASSFPVTTVTTPFLSTATASEAVMLFPNGGNWFRFQNPFTISAADVADGAQFKLMLLFNPDGMMRAFSAPVGGTPAFGGCSGCNLLDSTGAGISTPMLGVIPIPFKAGQTVQKEVYTAPLSGTANGVTNYATVRLELFSIKEDTSRTIYGAQAMALPSSTAGSVTTDSFYPMSNIAFVEAASNGTLSFKAFDESALIDGFTRGSVAGSSASGVLHCGDLATGGWVFTGCSKASTVNLNFTLREVVDVAQ